MNVTENEMQALRSLLRKALDDNEFADYNSGRLEWLREHDPLAAALTGHHAQGSDRRWVCSCSNGQVYVSQNHVVLTHIRPIVEKAAMIKLDGILARAGMDLDVIIKSDKVFGGQ